MPFGYSTQQPTSEPRPRRPGFPQPGTHVQEPTPIRPAGFLPPAPRVDPQIGQLQRQLRQPFRTDPRIDALIRRIGAQQEQGRRGAASAAGLQAQLARMRAGAFNPNIGDVGSNAEAVAFRNAQERNLARAREEAASQQGATGRPGGGAFEGNLRGLREATGERVSGFEAGLAGRLRQQALEQAQFGIGATLTDLARQDAARQAALSGDLSALQALQGIDNRALAARAQQQTLLDSLLGRQGQVEQYGLQRGQFGLEEAGQERAGTASDLQNTLLEQEIERNRRELERGRPTGGLAGGRQARRRQTARQTTRKPSGRTRRRGF